MEFSDTIRIRMLQTVRPDFPLLAQRDTVLWYGEEYEAVSNKHGAISGICKNGTRLGVKPGEFEFVRAPEWVLQIWSNDFHDKQK